MLRKSVETMAISEFKATCVVALERVRRTGTPVVVTRWGGAHYRDQSAPLRKRLPRCGWVR